MNDEIKAEMARSVEYKSNRKLAEALDVSGDYVNRRIANRTSWDLHDLEVLGELFQLAPEVFVNRAVRTLDERVTQDELAAKRAERRPRTFAEPVKKSARKPHKPRPGE